jgi:hypothetical protein
MDCWGFVIVLGGATIGVAHPESIGVTDVYQMAIQ